MGKYDSTKTRVSPVFDQLHRRDPSGGDWLARLLAMPQRDGAPNRRPITAPIVGPIRHGKTEARIPPPITLLRYLIQHPERLQRPRTLGRSEATRTKREALLSPRRCGPVQAEALALLEKRAPRGQWYVLEGPTQPDVYLETSDAVVVIEGKRTERTSTRVTTWMARRDQMLRHLDGAWERLAGRRLYGFLIVENPVGLVVPAQWQQVASETVAPGTLRDSLPHRPKEQQRAIADAFLGVTTWQQVCQAFDLKGIV